jgi:hypothetical protein
MTFSAEVQRGPQDRPGGQATGHSGNRPRFGHDENEVPEIQNLFFSVVDENKLECLSRPRFLVSLVLVVRLPDHSSGRSSLTPGLHETAKISPIFAVRLILQGSPSDFCKHPNDKHHIAQNQTER